MYAQNPSQVILLTQSLPFFHNAITAAACTNISTRLPAAPPIYHDLACGSTIRCGYKKSRLAKPSNKYAAHGSAAKG